MSRDELDSRIQLIIDALPDAPPGAEKRRYALTKNDMIIIIDAMRVMMIDRSCALDMTEADAEALTSMVKERKRILAAIGTLVILLLAFIGEQFIKMFDSTFWHRLFGFK